MSTFLLILKIIPWVLTLGAGVYGYFTKGNIKKLADKIAVKDKTIGQLKGIVLSQGEDLEKKQKEINAIMEINAKYETKKKTIKTGHTATDSMASKR